MDAKTLLLAYGHFPPPHRIILMLPASCFQDGLIPNLLDSGRSPRCDHFPRCLFFSYNARDAVWWFLFALQEFCAMAPDGLSILKAKVNHLLSL
jgi:glycogen debranching enzyme